MSWRERRRREDDAARKWNGAYRPYDLVKEFSIAVGVVLAIVLLLTILFSSPDERPTTIKQWSRTSPVDFVTDAVSQLNGTSGTATYGPPYNHNSDGQHIAFIYLAKWFGVNHPIDTPQAYVLGPLSEIYGQPRLTGAISTYEHASTRLQTTWTTNYNNALTSTKQPPKVNPDDSLALAPGNYGPLTTLMSALLRFAQGGGLDGALVASRQYYQTDYTNPLLFLADGQVLTNRATAENLTGSQWGMMNETGSYPGQVWLWLYTFWYQIKPFSTSDNADILVIAIMGVLSLAFVLVPFLPGVSDLPRKIPVYKLIWRDHYRTTADASGPGH